MLGSQELVATLMDPKMKHRADTPDDGRQYLAMLRDLDLQSIAFIDQVLMGLRPGQRGTHLSGAVRRVRL